MRGVRRRRRGRPSCRCTGKPLPRRPCRPALLPAVPSRVAPTAFRTRGGHFGTASADRAYVAPGLLGSDSRTARAAFPGGVHSGTARAAAAHRVRTRGAFASASSVPRPPTLCCILAPALSTCRLRHCRTRPRRRSSPHPAALVHQTFTAVPRAPVAPVVVTPSAARTPALAASASPAPALSVPAPRSAVTPTPPALAVPRALAREASASPSVVTGGHPPPAAQCAPRAVATARTPAPAAPCGARTRGVRFDAAVHVHVARTLRGLEPCAARAVCICGVPARACRVHVSACRSADDRAGAATDRARSGGDAQRPRANSMGLHAPRRSPPGGKPRLPMCVLVQPKAAAFALVQSRPCAQQRPVAVADTDGLSHLAGAFKSEPQAPAIVASEPAPLTCTLSTDLPAAAFASVPLAQSASATVAAAPAFPHARAAFVAAPTAPNVAQAATALAARVSLTSVHSEAPSPQASRLPRGVACAATIP